MMQFSVKSFVPGGLIDNASDHRSGDKPLAESAMTYRQVSNIRRTLVGN